MALTLTLTLGIIAAVLALIDWVAVERRFVHLEHVAKPATLAVLIAAAAAADLGDPKAWVIAALVFGLVGDVALMLAGDDGADTAFFAGLSAFLAGHLCYLVAFAVAGLHVLPLIAGLLVVLGLAGLNLPTVLRAASGLGGRPFAGAVGAYAAALGAMTVLAAGTQLVATALGGLAFLISDIVLARDRFVARIPHGHLVVTVTYHLAQFLIVLGLAY